MPRPSRLALPVSPFPPAHRLSYTGEAWSLRGRTQFRAVGVTARTEKCLKGITCVRFTPKIRVYALNCVTLAQRNFLPRTLHASPLHVEINHVQGVCLNEFSPRLYFLAHQCR